MATFLVAEDDAAALQGVANLVGLPKVTTAPRLIAVVDQLFNLL